MNGVSPLRLWVMRAFYLFMAVGIGATVWPLIIGHPADLARMTGVALALLGTIGLLALLGLRYPLQMLPLLLFELIWKAVWLAAFALPRWLGGSLDEGMRTTIRPNDTYTIPPGHDEWVAGPASFVAVEFLGAASFGRRSSRGMHARV